MRKTILCMIILGVGFTNCTNQSQADSQTLKTDTTLTKTTDTMKNLVSIVEIPTTNFSRAVAFYQAILNVSIEETDMEGTKMGVFPSDGESVNVVLVNGSDYKPSSDGAVVYLNGGNDLQIVLDKVEQHGGTVIVPKTIISPEMGFFAMFIDSEGNKLGLHSIN